MPIISSDGNDYTVYADVDAADLYLAGSIHAAAWTTASDESKEQSLITATRLLDRQKWLPDYDTFDKRVVVPNIVTAAIELALALLNGESVQSDANTSQKIASLQAGTAAITYFRGAEGTPRRFQLLVWELLRYYLDGSEGISFGGSYATGTSGCSATRDKLGLNGPL